MRLLNALMGCGMLLTTWGSLTAQEQICLADPTIVCFDNVYYMYGTESKPQTGIPVLKSVDLKFWEVPANTMEGHALEGGKSAFGTWGFWAPQVLRHENKYYMLYTANENIAIAQSNKPTGPFIQQTIAPLKADTKQIDPFLFIDTDGKMYLYHVRLHEGNSIWAAEFNKDMTGVKKETLVQCITATEPWEDTQTFPSAPIIEGPTVVKHKGLYYLFYSANHFQSKDYAVGYAVSTSPLGPWNKPEGNPIINQKLIHQNGTGHGDLFRDIKGNWKYVFHVHANDSTVSPRYTQIIDVAFVADKATGIGVVRANPQTLATPVLK